MKTTTLSKPSLLHRLLITAVLLELVQAIVLIAAILLGLAPAISFGADKAQVRFDGKDLAGWRAPTGTWSVAKGDTASVSERAKRTGTVWSSISTLL